MGSRGWAEMLAGRAAEGGGDARRGLDLDRLKDDPVVDVPGEERLDLPDFRDAGHEGRGPHQIGPLHEFEPSLAELEAIAIERTVLVGDEDDPLETVDLDQELQLVDDALFLEMGLRMARQARRPAGQGDAVIAGKPEAVLKKVVEVLADAAVRAVDRGGPDAGTVVGKSAFVGGGHVGLGEGSHGRPV